MTAGERRGRQDQSSIAETHLAFSKENVRVKPGSFVRGNIWVRMTLCLSCYVSRSLAERLGSRSERVGGSRGNVRVFVFGDTRSRYAGRNLV